VSQAIPLPPGAPTPDAVPTVTALAQVPMDLRQPDGSVRQETWLRWGWYTPVGPAFYYQPRAIAEQTRTLLDRELASWKQPSGLVVPVVDAETVRRQILGGNGRKGP
jgi:hypothetical protein